MAAQQTLTLLDMVRFHAGLPFCEVKMKTNCTRYDPKTGLCRLTNRPPKGCGELMAKYGIKPNTEFAKKVHEEYYKEATSPEKLEEQVEVNTQRDIDMEKLASKTPENYNKATFYNEVVEKLDEQRKQEPEKPKRTWRNLIKLFHDDEPKRKLDGYTHNYRR